MMIYPTDTASIPDTLYAIVYAEQMFEGEPYIFVYTGVFPTAEAAEQNIMEYALDCDKRGTFNLIQYDRPPF